MRIREKIVDQFVNVHQSVAKSRKHSREILVAIGSRASRLQAGKRAI